MEKEQNKIVNPFTVTNVDTIFKRMLFKSGFRFKTDEDIRYFKHMIKSLNLKLNHLNLKKNKYGYLYVLFPLYTEQIKNVIVEKYSTLNEKVTKVQMVDILTQNFGSDITEFLCCNVIIHILKTYDRKSEESVITFFKNSDFYKQILYPILTSRSVVELFNFIQIKEDTEQYRDEVARFENSYDDIMFFEKPEFLETHNKKLFIHGITGAKFVVTNDRTPTVKIFTHKENIEKTFLSYKNATDFFITLIKFTEL
jgi:hypothetical protein